MPWLVILLIIVAAYLGIMGIKAVRDLVIWYREGRTYVAEKKRFKALRQQRRSQGLSIPALKERAPEPTKPTKPTKEARPDASGPKI